MLLEVRVVVVDGIHMLCHIYKSPASKGTSPFSVKFCELVDGEPTQPVDKRKKFGCVAVDNDTIIANLRRKGVGGSKGEQLILIHLETRLARKELINPAMQSCCSKVARAPRFHIYGGSIIVKPG